MALSIVSLHFRDDGASRRVVYLICLVDVPSATGAATQSNSRLLTYALATPSCLLPPAVASYGDVSAVASPNCAISSSSLPAGIVVRRFGAPGVVICIFVVGIALVGVDVEVVRCSAYDWFASMA